MHFEKEIIKMENQLDKLNKSEIKPDVKLDELINSIEQGKVTQFGEEIIFKQALIENQILWIPNDFELMPPNLIEAKYPYLHCADYILTNEKGKIDICYEFIDASIEQEQFKTLAYGLFNNFCQVFPEIEIANKDFKTDIGNETLYFDFIKSSIDEDVYVFMALLYREGEVSMFSLSSPVENAAVWKQLCPAIVSLIRFNEYPIDEKQ